MEKSKRLLLPVFAICIGAFFVYGRELPAPAHKLTEHAEQAEVTKPVPYVQRRALWPQLRKNLEVLGDRLEKPGKERTILVGTVRHAGDRAEIPCELVREFPDRLRLIEQQVTGQRSTAFDGRATDSRTFTAAESDSIETLVFDSVEYFFATRMEGTAASFLGSKFRLDDGTASKHTGPLYDIFLTIGQRKIGQITRHRAVTYYFNSQSRLLERVRYQQERNGSLINVEVLMSDWRNVTGQMIPMRVERFENGSSVFKFSFATAVISPKVSDTIFAL